MSCASFFSLVFPCFPSSPPSIISSFIIPFFNSFFPCFLLSILSFFQTFFISFFPSFFNTFFHSIHISFLPSFIYFPVLVLLLWPCYCTLSFLGFLLVFCMTSFSRVYFDPSILPNSLFPLHIDVSCWFAVSVVLPCPFRRRVKQEGVTVVLF